MNKKRDCEFYVVWKQNDTTFGTGWAKDFSVYAGAYKSFKVAKRFAEKNLLPQSLAGIMQIICIDYYYYKRKRRIGSYAVEWEKEVKKKKGKK